MSKKEGKKDSKAIQKLEQEKAMQKAMQEEQQRLQKERQQKQRHQAFLAKQSSPLIQFGLLDGYQYFLLQLTQAGIPQANVFQFAAQMILKYEKNKQKKLRQIESIQKFNQQVVKQKKQSPLKGNKTQKSSLSNRKSFNKRPNLYPFKGEISEKQMSILGGGGKVKIGEKEMNNPVQQRQKSKLGEQQNFQNNQFDEQGK